MIRTRRRDTLLAAVAIAAMATVAACAPTPPVDVERAERSDGPLAPDRQAGLPDVAAGDTDAVTVPPPETSIEWAGCASFGIPEWVESGTSGWECGRLVVDMDPFADTAEPADLPDVVLGVTRHRATGDRRGTIVVNPGGPGAAGLPTAWGIRPVMPTSLLRSFDIVAWDPRGVGNSTPRADCAGADSFDDGFIAACVAATGPLSRYLSAPYTAADMEALRIALGEEELNFLGFSYGSILGATFAARHPQSVGAFVLDGVTDPATGSLEGPFEDGFAAFADDGRPAARDRFVELCAASSRCLGDQDPGQVLDELAALVGELPTERWDGQPDRVDRAAFDELIDVSLTYAGDWEPLATALADAAEGDASALASVIADSDLIGPDGESDADGDGDEDGDGSIDNFTDANFMIYCADFGPMITAWSFCDEMPRNAEPLLPVTPVDIERPMLVIGTEFDPLTPGKHAPEFAAAIGDAIHIIWEGVGHTAFPGWTDCIDDAVAAQFLGTAVPPDGTRCTMLEGITDDAELGDDLFGYEPSEAVSWITEALETRADAGGVDGSPECVASAIVPADPDAIDDRVVSHVVLDVTSDAATVALDAADARC